MWNIGTQRCLRTLNSSAKTAVNALCISNGILYSAHGGSKIEPGTVELWHIGTYQSLKVVSISHGTALELATSNNCCYVMTGQVIQVLRCGSMDELRNLKHGLTLGNEGALGALHFIPRGHGELVSAVCGTVVVWG
jgi:hypothetical protein